MQWEIGVGEAKLTAGVVSGTSSIESSLQICTPAHLKELAPGMGTAMPEAIQI